MYAIGAHGNLENLPNFKKASASQLTSPLHKRTRIMFDDILANAAKKGRKGQNTLAIYVLYCDEKILFPIFFHDFYKKIKLSRQNFNAERYFSKFYGKVGVIS